MLSRTSVAGIMLGAAAAAVLAGCSGGGGASGSPSGAPPKLGPAPTPTSLAGVTYPLSAYQADAQDSQTLSRATNILIKRCMSGLGFGSWTAQQVPDNPSALNGPGVFGFLDAARAAQYGFHDPAGGTTKSANPQGAVPVNDSRAEIAALTGVQTGGAALATAKGVPQGGCTGEARRQLRGTAASTTSITATLTDQAYQRSLADSRVVAGIKAWSTCMQKAGYTYSAPNDLATEAWGPQPNATEIATAKADVVCTRRTNLTGIGIAVLDAEENQLIEQHKQELDQEKATLETEVRKAAQVIEGQS